MNSKRFYHLVDKQIDHIKATLVSKGQEYSTNENKLHNFDKAARMSNQSREKALLGMMLKHTVSIDDIVEKIDKELPTISTLNEKIGDAINYLILLKACIIDRIEKKEINEE